MSSPHTPPTRRHRVGMQHACSVAVVAATYMVDRTTALDADGWRGMSPSMLGNYSGQPDTLSKAMIRSTYDFYFTFILVSTMLAVASALCGITICLFCKNLPNSDM